jgi:hypothetical protein
MADLSLQNDDTRNQFRTLFLEGKEYIEICEILGIPKGTFDSAYYRNTHSLRDWLNEIKKERILRTVESFSKELMATNAQDNAKMKAIQQKEAEFLRETLLKEQGYTKRIETIGFNVNKNEPLDDEQKERLNKLIKKSGTRTANYTIVSEDSQGTQEIPIDNTTQDTQAV